MTMFKYIDGQEVEMTAEEVAAFLTEQEGMSAPAIDDYKRAFDANLDAVAQSKLYDNRVTIATYSGSSNPQWASEAVAFIAWRDAAILSMFAQLEAVRNGGPQPTVAEFLAALPAIDWPTV